MKIDELVVGSFSTCVIEPYAPSRGALVMLHGYTMDAEDLAPLASAMNLPVTLYLPRAALSVHPRGRTWWPVNEAQRLAQIASGPRDLSDQYPVTRASTRSELVKAVNDIRKRHCNQPLYLAGFSQGGMLACDAVLCGDLQVDRLFIMSSSCIALADWQPVLYKARNIPTFISHGRSDSNLSFRAGERLRDALSDGGAEVTWFPFDGGHEVPIRVWREIRRTITAALRA
jgi:phospholipase/carboxylesterase